MTKRIVILAATAALALVASAPASAATTAGDWIKHGRSTMPLNYFQGITHDDQGNVFFDGVAVGLYRTNTKLKEEARNLDVIDPAVKEQVGFNHIGDITWDRADGGRIILPLECYDASKDPSNTCGVGGFGVADPNTLTWQYWVKLDPADIPKAMWAEVSPDGALIWTSAGRDLLAYHASDVTQANAQRAPGEVPPIRPAKRLAGAVPAQGITGAVFVGRKLLVAGQDGARFQVSSVDLKTGKSKVVIEEKINGESEGLDTFRGLGGNFHWMVMPISQTGKPSFDSDKGSLLNYKGRVTALALTVTPDGVKVGHRTKFSFQVLDNNADPVKGATVSFAHTRATTNGRGRATVTKALPRGTYTATVAKRGLTGARAIVRSSR